jgi:Tfp pilus assembly protein PilF
MNWKRRLSIAVLVTAEVLALVGCGGGPPKKPKQDPATAAQTHYRMAQAMIKNGRISESLAEMDQAVALAPSNAEMANFHGQVLLLAGRYPLAEKELQRALALDPYMTDVRNNLGALYDRMGKKTEAEEQYRLALADPAFPSPEKVHLNLGMLYGSEGRNDEAIKELRTAVEIDPQYFQAHYELAGRLETAGKLDESAREYEVAAPDYRGSGEYHYRLGLVYLRLGNKPKAQEHLRRVVDLSPGSENASRADELLKTVR